LPPTTPAGGTVYLANRGAPAAAGTLLVRAQILPETKFLYVLYFLGLIYLV